MRLMGGNLLLDWNKGITSENIYRATNYRSRVFDLPQNIRVFLFSQDDRAIVLSGLWFMASGYPRSYLRTFLLSQ
jgi:hypothetical protein